MQKVQKFAETYIVYDDNLEAFKLNKLAYLNEKYCYEIQKFSYQNGLIIRKQLTDSGFELEGKQHWNVYEEQVRQMI